SPRPTLPPLHLMAALLVTNDDGVHAAQPRLEVSGEANRYVEPSKELAAEFNANLAHLAGRQIRRVVTSLGVSEAGARLARGPGCGALRDFPTRACGFSPD